MTASPAALRRRLAELSKGRRTGALHVDGSPGGVFYLVRGRIAYAESPASPGLADRLIASGRIAAGRWAEALAEGRDGHEVARVLLRDGLIGHHELAQRVFVAISDATAEILNTAAGATRFVAGERHWLGDSGLMHQRTRPGDHDAHRVRLIAVPSPQDGPR